MTKGIGRTDLPVLFAGRVLLPKSFEIGIDTVKKADTHCNCSDIEIFFLDHFIGLDDLFCIYH